MTPYFLPTVRDHLGRLADTLGELRRRVREAVAVEMGRVVSETVRDLLTAILRREPADRAAEVRTATRHRGDPWNDEDDSDATPETDADGPPPERAGSGFWPAVLSFGLTVAHWLLRRHPTWWPATGFGTIVAASPLARNPLARNALAAVATAAELVRLTGPSQP